MCVLQPKEKVISAHNPMHVSKHLFLKWGRGRQSPAFARLCAPPLSPSTENTQDARSNTALSKAAPAATQGHTPSRPHATNIPTQGHADLPTLSVGDTAWTLSPTSPRQGAAHFGDSHALQIIFFLHSQLSTWTLQTLPRVLGAISLQSHGPAGTNYRIDTPRSIPIPRKSGVASTTGPS